MRFFLLFMVVMFFVAVTSIAVRMCSIKQKIPFSYIFILIRVGTSQVIFLY